MNMICARRTSLMRCLTSKRYPSYFLLAFFIILTILIYTEIITINSNTQSVIPEPSCEVAPETRNDLYPLIDSVSKLWTKLSVENFLCYGSLWGAIQEAGPLPWEAKAEMCLITSQLVKHDEVSLLREFRRQGLNLVYSSAEGEYTISNASLPEDSPVTVLMVLFEEDERLGMLRRVGWKRRLLPPDCEAHPILQCFPPSLAKPPLPLRNFGPLSLPAPRENIDLLKFHYPDTWWKPLKPNCETSNISI